MTATVCFLDGTWAGNGGTNVAEAFRRALDPHKFRFRYVSYPGKFGPATGVRDISFAESVQVGMTALWRAIDDTPGDVVIGAYSQGCSVARGWAAKNSHPRVKALAMIADPHEPVHQGKAGISGQLPCHIKRFSAVAPGDPICDLPIGNPLRSVADMSKYMSIRSWGDVVEWGDDLLQSAINGRNQAWWRPDRWRDWGGGIAYARGYLVDSRHVNAYVNEGYAAGLARTINKLPV